MRGGELKALFAGEIVSRLRRKTPVKVAKIRPRENFLFFA
jgi:hypothetical protein